MNLIDNAAKWTRPGTAIDVRLANGELTIRDRGPGIARDDMPHIFESFYRSVEARSLPGSSPSSHSRPCSARARSAWLLL
jgi:two-component system sensor histidine kinase MprB